MLFISESPFCKRQRNSSSLPFVLQKKGGRGCVWRGRAEGFAEGIGTAGAPTGSTRGRDTHKNKCEVTVDQWQRWIRDEAG